MPEEKSEILLTKLIANEQNYLKDPLVFYYNLRSTVYADNFEKVRSSLHLTRRAITDFTG